MKKRIVAVFLLCLLLMSACVDSNATVSMKEVQFVMSTVVSLDIRDHASEELMNKMMDRLEEIDVLMSLQKKGSDIDRVNEAKGEITEVNPSTYHVIKKAIEYSEMTDRAFDPSIGLLVNLWGIGTETARLPSPEEIETARMTSGLENIELLGNNQLRLHGDTQVDIGAIAKGFAADEMVRIAKEAGVKSAIFNLGGNVYVLGSKGTSPFRVGIQNPFSDRDDYLGIIDVKDTSVVTSGNYERFFFDDAGKRYHHILDPKTGYPAENGLAGVTVVCSNSTMADALSTAIYVMGLEKGLAFIEATEEAEALFVTNTRDIHVSSGLRSFFTLVDDTFRIVE
jgi:thiamine biosynthesis lipoprotein